MSHEDPSWHPCWKVLKAPRCQTCRLTWQDFTGELSWPREGSIPPRPSSATPPVSFATDRLGGGVASSSSFLLLNEALNSFLSKTATSFRTLETTPCKFTQIHHFWKAKDSNY